jgi:hypothetical protein
MWRTNVQENLNSTPELIDGTQTARTGPSIEGATLPLPRDRKIPEKNNMRVRGSEPEKRVPFEGQWDENKTAVNRLAGRPGLHRTPFQNSTA